MLCKQLCAAGLADTGRRSGVTCLGSKGRHHARSSLPATARRHILSAVHAHLARAKAEATVPDHTPADAGASRSRKECATPSTATAPGAADAAECQDEFRARCADDRRRNVLRRAFGLVSREQRRDLREALQQRLAAARAVQVPQEEPRDAPPAHVSAGASCWHDSAAASSAMDVLYNGRNGDSGSHDTMSEDDSSSSSSACSDVSGHTLHEQWAAGKAAKSVLWGRAKGSLPVDASGEIGDDGTDADAADVPDDEDGANSERAVRGEDPAGGRASVRHAGGDGVKAGADGAVYAGKVERIRRWAQFSDEHALAEASWRMAGGQAPLITGAWR